MRLGAALHGGLWRPREAAAARAWLNATPGCSSSSRWMYWGNFRFMPKTPVTTAPIPIVIEMAVAITSILSRRLRAESRL